MATRLPTAARNAACDAIVDRIDAGAAAGTLELRTGPQPSSANNAATGTLLATFTLPDPCFGNAAAGTATANAITSVLAAATGTAGWFRVKDSDGNSVVDGSVTATGGGGDLELNAVAVTATVAVTITAWTVTMSAG